MQVADLPSFAVLTSQSLVPGGDGQPALRKHLPHLRQLLRKKIKIVIIDAATGSGKSRDIPSVLTEFLDWQLLVATPNRIDVKGMQRDATVPSCYRMGKGDQLGSIQDSKVVFATTGLVQQWYATQGDSFLWYYSGIYFDEIDAMEQDPGFALLWGVTLLTQLKRDFLIVGASATFSPALLARFAEADVTWIRCPERPYPVELYEVEVPTNADVYVAVQHFCIGVLRKNKTALVFLPGKAEIESVRAALQKAGIDSSCLFPLHADMDTAYVYTVTQASNKARVILSTSLAETSITIPDVDYVIDVGLSRRLGDYHDLLDQTDVIASKAVKCQRLGRVGRVKRGCCVQITNRQLMDLGTGSRWCDDSVMRVYALQAYHSQIQATGWSLCPLPCDVLDDAINKLSDLHLSTANLWKCLTQVPLPLKDAATLLKACDYGVGYEAAAVLALRTQSQWSRATKFNLKDLVTMVSGRGLVPEDIRKIEKARALFRDLERDLKLEPSRVPDTQKEERLAVAFLCAPERLLWCDTIKGHGAAFLGAAVSGLTTTAGCVVAILLSKGWGGLSCSLALPVSPWVLQRSGLTVPTHTARLISDSTLMPFRAECCNKLRMLGYDVKVWRCKGGASEHEVAVSVATTGSSHLCIAVPNGNRLERQRDPKRPRWIPEVCEHLCAALSATAERAAVFVGDASLSPGVAHASSYAALVPMLQKGLKEFGLGVTGHVGGLALAADGKHWSISSRASVEALMDSLCSSAVPTSNLKPARPPPLWHWRYNATHACYYPCCVACDTMASDAHLASKPHLQNTHGTRLSFDFPNRDHYCNQGVVMHVGGISQNGLEKSPYLPANYPLTPKNQPGAARQPTLVHVVAFTLIPIGAELTPNVPIPRKCQGWITWSDDSRAEEDFVMPAGASGRKRSALSASRSPWVVKCESIVDGERNRNLEEYKAFMASSVLRDFVPQVHGYFEQDVGGRRISMLLMDRIAFTFGFLIEKLMQGPLNESAMNVVVTCVLRVVRRIAEAAERGIQPRDWHVGNLAFHDDQGASQMFLVDFEKNMPAAATATYKDRMHKTMLPFWEYLPGPISWGATDAISSKTEAEQTVIRAWRRAMMSISAALENWWRAWCSCHLKGDELPSQFDWEELGDSLRAVAVESYTQQHVDAPCCQPETLCDVPMHVPSDPCSSAIASTVMPPTIPTRVPTIGTAVMPASIPTRVVTPGTVIESSHTTFIQTAPALCQTQPRSTALNEHTPPQVLSPLGEPTDIHTAENTAAAEQILGALSIVAPVSNSGVPWDPSPYTVVGRDAARGLLIAAAAEQRRHAQKPFKARRPETANSKPLQERKRIHNSGGLGFDHHPAQRSEHEGNDLGLLFRLLLAALKKPREAEGGKGLLERMPFPPKAAQFPEEFHSRFWEKFARDCDPPWLEMTPPQKGRRLHAFLFTKFSMDPKAGCMFPGPSLMKKLRNDAAWIGFWLRDTELISLVAEVMEEYALG